MGIDFLGLEQGGAASMFRPETSPTRASRLPGVQNSMPKLNARLERTGATSAAPAAIAEGFVAGPPEDPLFFSPLPSAEQRQRFLAPVPLRSPGSKFAAGTSPEGAAAPLTIFYDGTVTTFNLPRDKAEAIIKRAERTTPGVRRIERPSGAFVSGGGRQQQPPESFSLDKLAGDLPLARKRSLQRFLEKRKERLDRMCV